MKYVPSLPPPATAPRDSLGAKALARVKPALPVQVRTLPPLVIRQYKQPYTPPDHIPREEGRHAEPLQEERRTYCRRIKHQPIMEELRSAIERRQHNRTGSAEHIDEEA